MDEHEYAKPIPRYVEHLEASVPVPMRDGVRLSTDLHLPVGAGEPLPAILLRTPYNKHSWRGPESDARVFAGQGFAVVVQDTRGTYESEGDYVVSAADADDGYDAIEWIVRQPWSNGRVGTYGCSYLGENQLQLSSRRHPNHACAVPKAASGGMAKFGVRPGGAVALQDAVAWFRGSGSNARPRWDLRGERETLLAAMPYFPTAPTLPAFDILTACRTLPIVDILRRAGAPPSDYEGFVSHDPGDAWWTRFNYITSADRFDVPALFVDSWYDFGPGDTLRVFNLFREHAESDRARDNIFAVMAPGTHCSFERATERTIVGSRDVGDARFPFWRLYLAWFDHWLRGVDNGVTTMPKLRIFVMGRNAWRDEQEWPLARTRFTPYYLHSAGHANSRFGDGILSTEPPAGEPADRYAYDPATPVPSSGGPSGVNLAGSGAHDQSEVEMRHDVLVYTSPPLEHGVEVTGPLEVVLYVSSSAPDTDFTAKLVDVDPDGAAYNVQEGILRARYRESLDGRARMVPGEIYELRIDLQATSNWFAPGHCIRLEVASSNFPRFDRNLNTGGNNWDETAGIVAHNTVHHSARHPSHILLPVVE